jgi:predicted dehydrogenase
MKESELKGVMAGAGFFAAIQAEAWSRLSGARIAAIADKDKEKGALFAKRFGIAAVYDDVETMLATERPDFLDIVTGPDTHRELTELAARAHVPVICQKPLAPKMEDCVAMVECCEEAGVPLLVHENWRWQPWYRQIGSLIRTGALGSVYHIAFRMRNGDGRGDEPYTVQPYFRRMDRFLIFETLVHFLDTFRYLGGEIRRVYCQTARINPLIRGEDYALIQLAFESGAHGLIDANRISGPMPLDMAFGELRVEGERAAVRMSPEGRLWLTEYPGREREYVYELPAQGYKGDSVYALQRHLLTCLRDGAASESAGRDYLKTVAAVEACYESAASGSPIGLGAKEGTL